MVSRDFFESKQTCLLVTTTKHEVWQYTRSVGKQAWKIEAKVAFNMQKNIKHN